MWTRKQLKERARNSFYRNRWRTVLVSLLTVLYLGALGYAGSTVVSANLTNSLQAISGDSSASSIEPSGKPDSKPEMKLDESHGPDSKTEDDADAMPDMGNSGVNLHSHVMAFSVVIILLAALGMAVVAALGLAVIALVVNPLLVGCRRFFFINLNTPARVGELGYGFDTNYRNIVRVMLRKTIYTILWSCLFVVPGLVKNYEYMMVPYILAEGPDIDRRRAFAISKEMMHGNKWKAFLLDLSFIPWNLLSSITLGIVSIFHVSPYKNMTYAAFYEQMRSNYTQKRMAYMQPEQNAQRPGQDVQQQGRTAQRPGQNAQPGQDAQRQCRTAQQSGQNVQRSEQGAQQDGGMRREGMGE